MQASRPASSFQLLPSHLRYRTSYHPSHTIVPSSHSQMADNPFPDVWKAAIERYEADTSIKISVASRALVSITSVDGLLEMIEQKQNRFMEYRKRGERIKGALRPVLDIIGALAGALGEGIALSFPPGKAVFVAVKSLVDATRNVKAHYDAIIDIFERMHNFLLRCETYLGQGVNISSDVQQKIVKIFAHLLLVVGIVIKDMKRGRLNDFVHGVFVKNTGIQDALGKLDQLTREEAQAVQAAIYDGVGQTLNAVTGLTDVVKGLADAQRAAELRDCYHWLSAPDPWVNHNAAQDKLSHEQNTGQWIFDNTEFVEWKDNVHSSMWLYGKPGGGKSVLCSTIIKMLQDQKSQTSCAVAFFYFDFRDPSKQKCYDMLKSLLVQLGSQSSGACDVLKQLYANHGNDGRQPGRQTLLDALGDILKQLKSAYVIFDALDECFQEDRHNFLFPFLDEMMLCKEYSVHFLATSRNELDIKNHLEGRVSYTLDLSLDNTGINRDIKIHLATVLDNEKGQFYQYPGAIKKEITETLLGSADGMFLWVQCQLSELAKCSTTKGLRKALHNLPATLEDTYSRILQTVNDDEADILHILLCWITFSVHPLTERELEAALQLSLNERDSSNEIDESLQLYSSTNKGLVEQQDKDNALHIAADRGNYDMVQWLLLHGAHVNTELDDSYAIIRASASGNLQVLRLLLAYNAVVNVRGHYHDNALMTALFHGHSEILQILVQNGAYVDTYVGEYGTALIAASYRGQTEIAQILVQNGADVNAQD
ncbi:hypothetical protein EVG20_g11059, partial [Dentipellis fragilis]